MDLAISNSRRVCSASGMLVGINRIPAGASARQFAATYSDIYCVDPIPTFITGSEAFDTFLAGLIIVFDCS